MENTDWLKVFISGFLVIILGMIFLQIIGSQTNAVTQYQGGSDSKTWTKNTNITLAQPYVTFFNVTNSSGVLVTATNYTLFAGNTSIVFLADNSSVCKDAQTCIFNYQYQPSTYVVDSSSRSILSLNTLFFALAVVGFAIWMFWDKLESMFNSMG